MVSVRRRIVLGSSLVAFVLLAILYVGPPPDIVKEKLPEKLSDAEFWSLINEFSEPGGYFRSENLVSNETEFQKVIPQLKQQVKPDGVYLGVGPDQNFTYIAALEPKLAFVIDIRRQNMLLHLMYKALFELSSDRSQFLSNLFARPLPPGVATTLDTEELFEALDGTASNPELARRNLDAILQQLRGQHHFDLTVEDSRSIEHVYNAFVSAGPDIRYSFPSQYARRRFPSYAELMLETDGTAEQGGERHSYVASEEKFQAVKKMESQNRIVPIVGDFAGDKALRAVGRYMREHGATVSTFYTSNVEFYLFQTEDWKRFFDTVSQLPMNSDSVFIRSYFNSYGVQFPNPPAWLHSQLQSYTLLDSMPAFVDAFNAGRIRSYSEVVRRSKP